MARSSFGRGELLLVALRLLQRRPMHAGQIAAELDRELGEEYRVSRGGVSVALEALGAEGLVEPAGDGAHSVTRAGMDALAQRAHDPILARLDGPASPRKEQVTILFTDVVGSTELLDRHGDEEAHRLRRRHFALLRGAVRDHCGREVKSLGDGLMVAFGSAPAAVECANEMQRAVAACDDGLALRVGIASGEAVHEEGDWFGRPVIVAKRLCDAAGPGEVLVCGPAEGEELEPVGPLVLKGLSEPVSASALRSRPLALTA